MSQFDNANSQIEELLREYDQNDLQENNCKNTDDLLAAMQKEYKSLFPNNERLPDIGEKDYEDDEYSYYDEEEDEDAAESGMDQGKTVENGAAPIKFEVMKDGQSLKMDDFEIIDITNSSQVMGRLPEQVSALGSD